MELTDPNEPHRGARWHRSAPRLFGDDGRADAFRFRRWACVWRIGRTERALIGPAGFIADVAAGVLRAAGADLLDWRPEGPWMIPMGASGESTAIWRAYETTCRAFRHNPDFARNVNEILLAGGLGALDWLEVRAMAAKQ